MRHYHSNSISGITLKFVILLGCLGASLTLLPRHAALGQSSEADGEVIDRVVAEVNDHIILKSDVDQRVRDYLRNSENAQFSKRLWYQVLESMIDNFVLVEQAKLDSVEVSDEEVNTAMDRRIDQLIERAGGEQQLEKAFGKSLVQIRSDYSERFRRDMLVQRVRQQKMQEISITRPEVEEFFNEIPRDSIPTVPERVGVSQIVRIPPPMENAKKESYQLAQQLRDSVVNHGKSIEDLAKRWSDGPSASKGGFLPMMPLGDLVAEYSAAASALEPGEISNVVETQFGYHIIKLNKRVGDRISTNHILLEIDQNKRDAKQAKKFLSALRDSVLNEKADFSKLAREYSEDERTANMGGRIINPQTGERLLPIDQMDPALYRITLLLDEEGDISKPKPFTPESGQVNEAFRIVRLDKRIPEHRANLKQDYDLIERIAKQRKQMEEMRNWISSLRDRMYVNYKINVPDNVDDMNLQRNMPSQQRRARQSQSRR